MFIGRFGLFGCGMIFICILVLTSTVDGNVDSHVTGVNDQDDIYFEYYPLYSDDEDFGRASVVAQMYSGDYEPEEKSVLYPNDAVVPGNLRGRGAIDPREIDYPDYNYIVGKTLLDVVSQSEADENYTLPVYEWEIPTEKPKVIENFEGQSILYSHRPDFYWTELSDDVYEDTESQNTTEKPSLVFFEGNLTVVATLDDTKVDTTVEMGERWGSDGEMTTESAGNATSSSTEVRASSNAANVSEARTAVDIDSHDSTTSVHVTYDTSGRIGDSNKKTDEPIVIDSNSTEQRAADIDRDTDIQNNVTNAREATDEPAIESAPIPDANATEQRTSDHSNETLTGFVANVTWRTSDASGESTVSANISTTEERAAGESGVTLGNFTDLRSDESLSAQANNATGQRTADDDDANRANVTQSLNDMDERATNHVDESENTTRASSDGSSKIHAASNDNATDERLGNDAEANATHMANATDQRVADDQADSVMDLGANATEERSVGGQHITTTWEQEGQLRVKYTEATNDFNDDVNNVPYATRTSIVHEDGAPGLGFGFVTLAPTVYDNDDREMHEATAEIYHSNIDDLMLPMGRTNINNITAEGRAGSEEDSVIGASNETAPSNYGVGDPGGRSFHNFEIGQDEFNRCNVAPYPCAIGDECIWNGRRISCVPRQIPTDPCRGQICRNEGICYSDNGQFRCDCPIGFSGRYCEIVGGPCHLNPCFGNCECVESCRHELGYYCQSKDGRFTGKNCTIPVPRLLCDPSEMKLILSPQYVQDFGIQKSMNSIVYASPDALGSHQRSPGCEAFLDTSSLEIAIPLPFNQCGTVSDPAVDGSGEQVFRNRLWIDKRGPGFDMPIPIVDFECAYKKEYRFVTSLKPVFDSPETLPNTVQIPINLQLCKIPACPASCPRRYSVEGGAAYTVGELIHLRASTEFLPTSDVVMSVEELTFSCDRERTTSPFHVIHSGCAANPGIHVRSSAGAHACITFQTPRAKNCPTVYLHAHVKFCFSHELTACGTGIYRCPSGLGRKKRSVGILSASVIGPLTIFEGATGRGGVQIFLEYNIGQSEPVKTEKIQEDTNRLVNVQTTAKPQENGPEYATILYAAAVVLVGCLICTLITVFACCLWRRPKKSRPIVSIT